MNGQRKTAQVLHTLVCSLVLMASVTAPAPQPVGAQPITFGDLAFARQWNYSDRAVSEHRVTRSWLWGPASLGPAAPAESHLVQYFDKARMEFNAQAGIVTNGRLVVEMMSGSIQTSLAGNEYFPLLPSTLPIAGDTAVGAAHPNTPTYSSLFSIATIGGSGPRATPSPVGTPITATYARSCRP
jgi:hypothetical protein